MRHYNAPPVRDTEACEGVRAQRQGRVEGLRDNRRPWVAVEPCEYEILHA